MSIDHTNSDTLQELYWDKELSLSQIGERAGVAGRTVSYWMDKHNIQTRGDGGEHPYKVPFKTVHESSTSAGMEEWCQKIDYENHRVRVHRLLAVSEYGFEEVCSKNVIHKNGLYWDNRPSNIELYTDKELIKEMLSEHGNPMKRMKHRERMSIEMSGSNHPNWRGGTRYNYRGDNWEEQREKALNRDDHTCQDCDVQETELDHVLHVHHIEPYEKGVNGVNEIDNLISLCPSCHAQREWMSND